MKILVCGSRNWSDIETIANTLMSISDDPTSVIIHGACRGADWIAGEVSKQLGFIVRDYPADWNQYKKAAGIIRNQHMLDVENKPTDCFDLCLAFNDDLENSNGTLDMVTRANKAGIPIKVIKSND